MAPAVQDTDIYRSYLNADVRCRLMAALRLVSEAHVNFLAKLARTDPKTARRAMLGYPPLYSEELSPSKLGLARLVETKSGLAFRITPAGERSVDVLLPQVKRVR